jgi:diaminohydroxyphosphoribosylaminopyrimidine deaminase/5-amino-6-(5-phosphoribosylamino)uracil reductase
MAEAIIKENGTCKAIIGTLMPNDLNIFEKGMKAACAEARKYLGATSPNPPVGAAALNASGEILAVAAHQRAGEAHAEAALLALCRQQGILDQVKTLCVTLEPCNHHGRTPPCTEAIIASGIKQIVIGTRDPNAHVKGGGIERLQEAGIEVITDLDEAECKILIHAFAYHAKTGLPWITVKRALTSEGSMIPPKGQKVFTSQASLTLAHRLRKKADAILTGSGTILADNPEFTVRHVSDHAGKQRYLGIMDRRKQVPESYAVAAQQRRFEPMVFDDIESAIKDLADKGVRDILVEAGPTLSKAVLDSHLWNMSVTIQQGNSDVTTVEFNTNNYMSFDSKNFNWENFLPNN